MHNKVLFKFYKVIIILIYIKLFYIKLTSTKDNSCYSPTFSDGTWTDRRPYFTVNMTFNDGAIRSLTWASEDIPHPIAKLRVIQKDRNAKISTLFNITARLCDIQQVINKVPMFKQALQTALKQGNYSFVCPMKRGVYTMDNMRVGNRGPMLAFMYRSKNTFTFIGGMYEEAANKSLLPLTTYQFKARIAKKSCKEF